MFQIHDTYACPPVISVWLFRTLALTPARSIVVVGFYGRAAMFLAFLLLVLALWRLLRRELWLGSTIWLRWRSWPRLRLPPKKIWSWPFWASFVTGLRALILALGAMSA